MNAYLIMEEKYDSDRFGVSIERPHLISFDKDLAEKYAKDNSTYRKEACDCHHTGSLYIVEEIEILEERLVDENKERS